MRLALLRSQTDERLVALAREGRPRAFEAIAARYRRPLLSAYRRIVPGAVARDALDQALLDAWIELCRGDDVRDVREWLFRSVRSAALRRSGHALVDAVHSVPRSVEEADRRAVVHETLATIARLPQGQRATLLRTALRGEEPDERTSGVRIRLPLVLVRWLASGSAPLLHSNR